MTETTLGMDLDTALRQVAGEVEEALNDLLPTVEGGEARLCRRGRAGVG